MAGNCGSCRQSTTGFSENALVAETNYQLLEVLLFCDWKRVYPPPIKTTVLTFLLKETTMKLSVVYIFENTQRKKLRVIEDVSIDNEYEF